jgi:hypothetical protein
MFTAFVALIGTPVMMYVAFTYFGHFSAVQFRIQDIVEDYTTGILTAIVLLGLIFLWPVPQTHRIVLLLLWLVRCGVTLGLMLPYEALYGLDASGYYRVGLTLNDPVEWLEFGQGTTNIMGFVGIVAQVTEAYSAIKVLFSYVGLVAIYILYRAAVICVGRENLVLLYALGLLPSLLFWTSILGKDPIVLLGVAIYCYGAAGLIVRQKLSMAIYVIIGLTIASYIRIWLGVIFITPLIATYVLAGRSSAFTKVLFMMIAVPGFLITLQGFSDQFNVETTQDLVSTTEVISSAWSTGGSAQEISGGFTSVTSMITFMPIGSFTALFRPLPFEVPNAFGLMAGIENLFMLSLFVIGIWRRGFGWIRQPILMWALSALLVWGAIYGFASYQNLGTAFRFRAQVAPILLLLGLYLTFAHRLNPKQNLRLLAWPVPPGQDETAPERAVESEQR